jgi:zinc transporter ZupT
MAAADAPDTKNLQYKIPCMIGLIPVKVERCRKSPAFLGVANAFAGGVFLAIAFMHILPEAAGDYAEFMAPNKNPFPLPYLLIFVGYTFILLIDKVVFDSHALMDGDHGHAHGAAVADKSEPNSFVDHLADPAEDRLL